MNLASTDVPNDLEQRTERLADELTRAGALDSPAWAAALRAVPRHPFIPARAWSLHGDGRRVGFDRREDPHAWWDAVYDPNQPIVTQFDDRPGPPGDRAQPSSSCPAPLVQFDMLHALAVEDGMRVLEIGTGTGWNAALLAHRLGDANVTTVEVDPDVTRRAERALRACGRHPTVACADGRFGYPLGAPYDRVIATCAVTAVPYAWIAQTRPGGIVLSPWTPRARLAGSPLARLVVGDDGTASGGFVGSVAFMALRQQRPTGGEPPPGLRDASPAGTATGTTDLDPARVLFRDPRAAFPVRLLLGDAACGFAGRTGPDDLIIWIADPATGSWARIHRPARFTDDPTPGTRFVTEQYGPRRLWDEAEAVHRWWREAGDPLPQRFGLTVTPDAQVVWLDDPARRAFRLPASAPAAFLHPTTR